MTFEEQIEQYKNTAKQIGRDFTEPDDDWVPVLLLSAKRLGTVAAPLPMKDEQEKQLTTSLLIPMAGLSVQAEIAAVISSAWMVEHHPPEDFDPENAKSYEDIIGMQPRDHPDRMEILMLVAASKDKFVQWIAKILRDGEQPPVLAEWELVTDELTVTGTFPDAVRAAVGALED